jgi:hypothetical protein
VPSGSGRKTAPDQDFDLSARSALRDSSDRPSISSMPVTRNFTYGIYGDSGELPDLEGDPLDHPPLGWRQQLAGKTIAPFHYFPLRQQIVCMPGGIARPALWPFQVSGCDWRAGELQLCGVIDHWLPYCEVGAWRPASSSIIPFIIPLRIRSSGIPSQQESLAKVTLIGHPHAIFDPRERGRAHPNLGGHLPEAQLRGRVARMQARRAIALRRLGLH